MKKTITKGVALALLLTAGSMACKDSFLNVAPTGLLVGSLLNTKDGLEGLLISAYTQLNGRGYSEGSSPTNWTVGSLMGGDANKGSDPADGAQNVFYVNYQLNSTTPDVVGRWNNMYEGVSRANSVLRTLPLAVASVSAATKQRISGEARFLRGLYYFDLKRSFNMVPYIDETVDYGAGAAAVANNVDIWPKIEADFQYAVTNLPETQTQAGRANKWAAMSYLARTYMYENKFKEAKALFDQIIVSGKTANGKKYGLVPEFLQVFNSANENSEEAIFSTQNVANVGSTDAASTDIKLNYPHGPAPGPGCCGFFQPTYELANSFRTTDNGLPIDKALANGAYDNSANELKTDQGLDPSKVEFVPDTRPVDPRLDLSIGRRGIPYLDWGTYSALWNRNSAFGGTYGPKKYSFYLAQISKVGDVSSWTKGWAATNVVLLRYADVLLMAAEAEIEAGSLATAMTYVNLVRARAANPVNFIMGANTGKYGVDKDGKPDYNNPTLDFTKPAANYKIAPYTMADFGSQDAARATVRFERKLELSGEGQRFFDLVRWKVAAPALNAFLTYEKTKLPDQYSGASFVASKNEYLPIPQTQIDLQGKTVLTQNPGY